ncbi:MAG: TetR/AcrR family transcriptional regulator [Thermoleophilia bacterium]
MRRGTRPGGGSGGRPRDPNVTQAITASVLELLGEVGYSALTIEGVAQRAGVGKTTIYRRFESKNALVAAAIGSLTGTIVAPDTGDTRTDVIELLSTVWLRLVDGPGLTLMGTFMVEANRNPKLFDEFRRQVIEPRRRPLREALERGQAACQLRADLDIEVALDLLVGPLLAALVTGGRPDEGTVRARVDAVWPALAAAGGPSSG